MAEVGSAFVSILPSAKGFGRKLDSQVGGDLDRSGKTGGRRFGTAFGGSIKGLIGPAIGLAVGAAAVSFLKDSVAEAREAQKVGAQTRAVIKSTGGAARLSAKDFGALATAISNKTGIDDEQIQAGENMLATFTNVKDAVGENNDIFSQATKLSTDLAVATGTDQVGANVLLGKALNDPAKGLSRLTKIGVTFTDQQKKQVEQMVAAGDTAGAQKVILKELGREFGGSAEAQATAADKAKVAFGNLKESVGTALLPVLDDLATFATEKLIPALYDIPKYFEKARDFVQPGIDAFRSFAQGSGDAGGKLQQVKDTISSAWESIKGIFTNGVSIVLSLWHAFGGNIVQFLSATFTNILGIIRGAFTVIQGIFKVISSLLKGDWKGVWDGIKLIVSGALTLIVSAIRQGFALIRYIFKNLGVILGAVFSEAWDLVKRASAAGISALVGLLRAAPGRAVGALGSLGAKLFNVASSAFGQLKGGAIAGVNAVVQFIKGAPKRISNGLGSLGTLLFDAGKAVIQGLINGIKSMIGAAVDAAKGAANAVKNGAKGALGVQSPSTVFHEIGINTMQGLENGINAQAPKAARAAGLAADSLTRSVSLPNGARPSVSDVSRSPASGRRGEALTRHDLAQILNGLNILVDGRPARLALAGA